jgi:CheY-like chemotaxis protein
MRLSRVRHSGGSKPRVLLVDDHPGMLDRVSAILADTFDVVGAANGGRQAVDMAHRLEPDVIVLDINMPGFDGFETKRALDHIGSRAVVVFLSLIEDPEYISEALRRGGRGYVVKSRMLSDLPIALDQVILGRRFVPSLPPLLQIDSDGGHAMHVHRDDDSFAAAAAALLDVALRRGDATCLIAPAPVRASVAAQLIAGGWDVGPSSTWSSYRAIDARAALDGLMRDGLPDATAIAAVVNDLDEYRRAAAGPASCLTVIGNMSALLCAAGNAPGAQALERFWDTLTRGRPFFTVCAFSTALFRQHAPDTWSMAVGEHSAVCVGSEV